MNSVLARLLLEYTAALQKYLEESDEGVLERAYEIGRRAVGIGLGVLDISAMHHTALCNMISTNKVEASEKMLQKSAEFFAECMSPVEMVVRGYRETNDRLITTNIALQQANTSAEVLLGAYQQAERVCTRFQEAALPLKLPVVMGFSFDAYYRPGPNASVIGGDWYDVLRLADGRIVLSIGDVCGSGLGAVIIMAMLRQVIRGVAYVHPDPLMILDAAGKALRSEHADAYASAFVAVIDPVDMTLTYASAGHPSPLLRLPNGEIEELVYNGVLLGLRSPVGGMPRRMPYFVGSLLVLYTDGLTETGRDISAGEGRLWKAIQACGVVAKDHFSRFIYESVLVEEAQDDVAILTVDVLPSIFASDAKSGKLRVSHWVFDVRNHAAFCQNQGEFVEKLRQVGATDDDIYAAEVVFSELVGNVLRYAPGLVEIFVDWTGSAPVLHILDQGPGFSYAPRLPRYLLAESGRGLFIVSSLTDDFNVTLIDEHGSHARAVISLSARQLSVAPSTPIWMISADLDADIAELLRPV